MEHHVFTIYDSAAKAYLPPFFLPEVGMAIRTFSDCVNSDNHAFARNPADYTLFEIGVFDDAKAEIRMETRITHGNGVEFQKSQASDLTEQKDAEPTIGHETSILRSASGGNTTQ